MKGTRGFATPVWLAVNSSFSKRRASYNGHRVNSRKYCILTRMGAERYATRRTYLHPRSSLNKITHLHRYWAPPWSRISAKRRIFAESTADERTPCAIVCDELTRRFGAAFNRDRMRSSSARITSRFPPRCDQIALSLDTKIYSMKIQPTFVLQRDRQSPWTNRFLDHAFAKRNVMLRTKFQDSTKRFSSRLDDATTTVLFVCIFQRSDIRKSYHMCIFPEYRFRNYNLITV